MQQHRQYETLGRVIRAHMALRDLRQTDVAKALGLSQAQVSGRFKGDPEWRVTELWIIAEHFGIPLTQLLMDVENHDVADPERADSGTS